jgi:hypothetical protein
MCNFRFGYNQWRDSIPPSVIVEKLCKDNKMLPPDYKFESVYIGGRTYYAEGEIENEAGIQFEKFTKILHLRLYFR